MPTESQISDRLRKIEALLAGAATSGERSAAEAARERALVSLAKARQHHTSVEDGEEMQFSMPDQWSRGLFLALCHRHGLKPFRRDRREDTAVVVRMPKSFLDRVLWPEFKRLEGERRPKVFHRR